MFTYKCNKLFDWQISLKLKFTFLENFCALSLKVATVATI